MSLGEFLDLESTFEGRDSAIRYGESMRTAPHGCRKHRAEGGDFLRVFFERDVGF